MENKKSNDFWISISDLMSGLMVIFLFIAVAYMYEIKDIFQGVIYVTEGFEDTEKSLYKELMKEFKNDLENWNAEIDAKTLSVIFKEPDILFGKGEHEIKPMFRKILNDFFPRYIDVLCEDEYKSSISSVRIEGHTSTEWKIQTPEKLAYLNNMSLSQARASEVLHYVLSTNLNGSSSWVQRHLQAVGYSSSKLITSESGIEDRILSRRVEFKVVTNSQEKLYELVSLVKGKTA